MRREGFVVPILCLALAGCLARPEMAGRVVDGVTGAPVAGALVSGGGASVVTGADGAFALPTTGEIAVARAGYLTARRVRIAAADGALALALVPEGADEATARALLREHAQDEDLDDMRPEARAQALAARETPTLTASVAPGTEPATIRVWRRKVDGSTSSCAGRVDVISFEDYVKGVVPHEWLASWDDRALEMGAVCARTFAWWWVQAGGKYPCADVDDTAASQVYTDGRVDKTDGAVDRTRGVTIVKDGALVLAEYSAENGDPTAFGVDEPYCAGKTVNGHGRGTCQWGTQRWAVNEGRDFRWMVAHYYPGATTLEPPAPDPTWAATVAAAPEPMELMAGADVEITVDLANTGTAAWGDGVELVTAAPRGRASPFYVDGAWLSAATVAAVAADPGTSIPVTLRLHAPAETQTRAFSESFALVHGDQAIGADPLITLSITVTAAPTGSPDAGPAPPPAPGSPGGAVRGDATGGCQTAPGVPAPGAWVLVALLALRRWSGRRGAAR